MYPTGGLPYWEIQRYGSCTWQRSLSRETNTGTSKEIPAFNQSWRCRNHPTPNWSYNGHKVPYLVPRTADCLSPLWSNTEHWPYAPGVCSVTGMSWRILHIWLIEYSLREKNPETCIAEFLREAGFFYLIWCNLLTSTGPQTWTIQWDLSSLFGKWEQPWDTSTCIGRLICPGGRVSPLNKSNLIQSISETSICLWSHFVSLFIACNFHINCFLHPCVEWKVTS